MLNWGKKSCLTDHAVIVINLWVNIKGLFYLVVNGLDIIL